MKMKIYTLTLLALASLFSHAQQQASSRWQSSNWYSEAQKWITRQQLAFRPMEKDAYAVMNPSNKLLFLVRPDGYQVKNAISDGKNWTADFSVVSMNNRSFKNPAGCSSSITEEGLVYHFASMDIQYVNGTDGLRQNFIIKKKSPHGLSLALKLNTSLALSLQASSGLSLADEKGRELLAYDGLKVWDAQHRPLAASIQLDKNIATIIVDDSHAQYPVTIDPLNHTPNWSDAGNGLVLPLLNDLNTPILYGYSISDAGDVNGDGFGDVIVGAPTYVNIINLSAGTFNAASVGAAFLYYGSPTGPSLTPDEVLQPTTQVGALFGFSVSKAGDLNGDGYSDIVIGAPGDRITLNVGVVPTATSVAAGKVYVYYGGPSGSFDGNIATSPTVSATLSLQQSDFGSLLSVPANPLYGFSVNEAGDVNGDGKADLLVGSPGFLRLLPVPLRSGRVDVYNGSNIGVSTTPSQSITGTILNALFGFSVNTAGNVNGDVISGRPVSDIIVGAPGSLTLAGAGQAYIFNGSATGITATSASQANATLSSGLLSTLFGFSVSGAGDVNGDGYQDVIIGEPAALESLLSQTAAVGDARIFYGSSSGISTSGSTTLTSPRRPTLLGVVNGNLLFGFSVSSAGDLDCDGFADVVVGEPGGTALSLGGGLLNVVSTNVLSGKSYVYTGRAQKPMDSPGFTIGENNAVSVANLIGYSVSSGGDYNGDGKADLLVGAPNGTLDLSGGILPAVGSTLNIVMTNSVGSAYAYSGCLQTNVVLPLTFLDFSAARQENKVSLNWTIDREEGITHYAVERSMNGRDFETIGIVFSMNTGQTVTYSFKDEHPQAVNYYRIQPVSSNNTERYSSIAVVRFKTEIKTELAAWPNPSGGDYSISCSGFDAGMCELRLYDMRGTLVQSKRINISDGTIIPMKRAGLAAGIYTASLFNTYGEKLGTAQIVLR